MKIYKYTLNPETKQLLTIPGVILSVESQGDNIVVYGLVEPDAEIKTTYEIIAYGTGHLIREPIENYIFLGTVKLYSESLIFHVFYKTTGEAANAL